MKRVFTFQNLIEIALLAIVLTLGAGVAKAQEDPAPEPTPAMSLKVNGKADTDRADAQTLVRVTIEGVEVLPTDGVSWDVVCGAKFLAADQVEALRSSLIFTGPESHEPYRVRLTFFRDGIVQKLESKVLIGKAPQPPPVIVPPLKTLAGADAPKLSAAYQELSAGIAAKLITSLDGFRSLEKQLLELRGLAANPAVPEIAKRWVGKTLEQLPGEIAKVVEELGAAPVTPVDPTTPATAVTYIYEKDDGTPPPAVMTGIDRLNREKKIRSTIFEEDTLDGDGQVPDQYKVALSAARSAGLPALVVTAGEKVLRVVKSPTTTEQVWGAAQ